MIDWQWIGMGVMLAIMGTLFSLLGTVGSIVVFIIAVIIVGFMINSVREKKQINI